MAAPKKRPDPAVFEQYRDEGRNASEVGRLLGVDKNTARKWAADAGVETQLVRVNIGLTTCTRPGR